MMALVAPVAFAACGGTDLVMGELDEAEAQDLAAAMMFAAFEGTGDVPQPAAASGPQAVPFQFASQFEGDVPCRLGGTVGVAAQLEVVGDTESQAGSVEYQMTHIHDACVVQSESHGLFTLWGNPNMSVALSVANNGQGVVEWGGSVQGAFDWVNDGREGGCEVALEFGGRQEGEGAVAGELAGMVCGFQISRLFSIG